ncbi:hypothetical protein BJP36_08525 [Moorena producens JHB]|uniref:Uncharacterized protein n=1 Tax=Moorena producens (strain JHB) TaxID=1454205 RepID=A0A1D9FXS4_MOOP1|nr:hypothetical protein [Moorena producens]AOY79960.2 hypothetical protein BJP36_08525 [Moorena producens JHB]
MTDIQRPNYFTAQFLVEEDFNDEQAYHRDMRLRHNRLLHDWGVVAGLEVTKVGDKKIAVSEGMAMDKDGREIIVLPNSPVPDTINLDGLPLNTTIEITIIYQEIQDKPYRLGKETKYSRTTERPKFIIYGGKEREHCDEDKVEVTTGSAPTDDNVIRLARVTLDNNGNVSTVDNSVRKLASDKLSTLDKLEVDGTISATNLNLTGDSTIDGSLTVNGNLEVKGDVIARDTEHIAGNVSLGDQDSDEVKVTGVIRSGHSSGSLRIDDALHTTGALTVDGNVGIGTNNPRQKLEVNGTVKATRFEGDGSGLTGISAGGETKWSDGDSNRIYYNAGNVGIGTNNPSQKLEVNGTVKATRSAFGSLTVDGNVGIGTTSIHNPQGWNKVLDILGSQHARLNVRSGGGVVTSVFSHHNWSGARGVIGTESNHPLTFATSYKHRMTIDPNGNVGIGTNNPSQKLEVDGAVKATRSAFGSLTVDGNVGIGTTSIHNPQGWNKVLDILGSQHARLNVRSGGGVVTSVFSHHNWSGARGVIGTESNHPLTFATSYKHRMTIDPNGNVGIGTNNPSQKLEVAGTVKATRVEGDDSSFGSLTVDGNVGIGTTSIHNPQGWNQVLDILGSQHARLNVRSGDGVVTSVFSHHNWNGARGVIGTESNHPLTFATNYQHRMTIDPNGNVGIGTTNPSEKLEVDGTVKATKFEGDGSALTGITPGKWSDGSSNKIYYNAGNVGIGTTNPQSLLQVGDGLGGGNRPWMTRGLQVAWNSDTVFLGLKDQGADRKDSVLAWGDNTNDAFRFIFAATGGAADGQEIMRLQPNGNVGIGTNNPSAKLEVAGTVKATKFEGAGNSTIDGSLTVNGLLEVKGNVSLGDADNDQVTIAGVIRSGDSSAALRVDDALHTTGSLTVDDSLSVRDAIATAQLSVTDRVTGSLTIENNLTVGGLLTTTLEVSGALKLATTGTQIFHNTNASGTPTGDGFRLRYDNNFFGSNQDALVIEKTDFNNPKPDGGIAFVNTANDGVVETALVIRGSGNVGIGTNNPIQKLEVAGTVNVRDRILRNGQDFSKVGQASHNDTVKVPWGTTRDWNIFVSPRVMGREEPGSEGDNALLKIECWARVNNTTSWKIHARYKYKVSRGSDHGTWHDENSGNFRPLVNYILIPR